LSKKKETKKPKRKYSTLDCYGIEPKGKGKITSSLFYPSTGEFKALGDLGKWVLVLNIIWNVTLNKGVI
jgi:hypothetical protein